MSKLLMFGITLASYVENEVHPDRIAEITKINNDRLAKSKRKPKGARGIFNNIG